MKVSMELLRNELKYLNDITKDDKYPYQFYMAYGSYGLDKVVNDGGGTKTIIGLTTKKDLYNQMEMFIKGILISKDM
jgi:hypothetical protein